MRKPIRKKAIQRIMKNIWFNICTLERDYGIEVDGHMTQILKFTIQCITDKYGIDLELKDNRKWDAVFDH